MKESTPSTISVYATARTRNSIAVFLAVVAYRVSRESICQDPTHNIIIMPRPIGKRYAFDLFGFSDETENGC